jgi:hypothetical protein
VCPDDVDFATKITHGRRALARALDAGVPASWATADEFQTAPVMALSWSRSAALARGRSSCRAAAPPALIVWS